MGQLNGFYIHYDKDKDQFIFWWYVVFIVYT